jgi:hypothetical protein
MTAAPSDVHIPFCAEHNFAHSPGDCQLEVTNNMGHRTDREILLNIETMMTQIRDLVADVATECGPVVQQIAGHGMFRMIFGKVKPGDDASQ